MLGVTSPAMVAAISNSGGMGSLPVGGLNPAICADLIFKTRNLTTQPFAVNLFAHEIPEKDNSAIEAMQDFLYLLCLENGFDYKRISVKEMKFHTYEEQVEVILREKVPIVSFTFGVLKDRDIERFQSHGVVLIGTCTSVKEALLLEEKGIDIICAQGIEAGGHRASFLNEDVIPQVSTFSLVPQVCDSLKKPVVAAGGIFDGRTINAAIILGAAGVQLGSAFINSEESLAAKSHKDAVEHSSDTGTVLTKSFSGRWARGIKNEFVERVDSSGLSIPTYPYQNALTADLRKAAKEKDDKKFISLWCGQSGAKGPLRASSEILKEMIADAENVHHAICHRAD